MWLLCFRSYLLVREGGGYFPLRLLVELTNWEQSNRLIQCFCGWFGDFQLSSLADPSLGSLISANSNLDTVGSAPLFAAINLCTSAVFIIHAPRVFGAQKIRKRNENTSAGCVASWIYSLRLAVFVNLLVFVSL